MADWVWGLVLRWLVATGMILFLVNAPRLIAWPFRFLIPRGRLYDLLFEGWESVADDGGRESAASSAGTNQRLLEKPPV